MKGKTSTLNERQKHSNEDKQNIKKHEKGKTRDSEGRKTKKITKNQKRKGAMLNCGIAVHCLNVGNQYAHITFTQVLIQFRGTILVKRKKGENYIIFDTIPEIQGNKYGYNCLHIFAEKTDNRLVFSYNSD